MVGVLFTPVLNNLQNLVLPQNTVRSESVWCSMRGIHLAGIECECYSPKFTCREVVQQICKYIKFQCTFQMAHSFVFLEMKLPAWVFGSGLLSPYAPFLCSVFDLLFWLFSASCYIVLWQVPIFRNSFSVAQERLWPLMNLATHLHFKEGPKRCIFNL